MAERQILTNKAQDAISLMLLARKPSLQMTGTRLPWSAPAFWAREQDTVAFPRRAYRRCGKLHKRSRLQPRTLLMIGGKEGLISYGQEAACLVAASGPIRSFLCNCSRQEVALFHRSAGYGVTFTVPNSLQRRSELTQSAHRARA